MRKIEFRGKTVDTNEWVFGGITTCSLDNWYIMDGFVAQQVHKESIGQLIEFGFYNEEDTEIDKSKEYVYEGDIILACTKADYQDYAYEDESIPLQPYRIGYTGAEAVLLDKDGDAVEQWSDGEIDSYGINLTYTDYSEIIGNYFDNPELMEDK